MGFRSISGSKKGFFPLELIFSMLGYVVAVFVIIIVLNISSCVLDKDKAESGISGKAETAAGLRAEAQLSSYLRTQIPAKDELFTKLDWLKEKRDRNFAFAQGFDVPKAKAFLEKYPDVYSGKDYSGFISALQAIYATSSNERGDVKEAFEAVTAAMFLRAFGDGRKEDGYVFYVLPIGVDFENSDNGKPSSITSLCSLANYDLCVEAGSESYDAALHSDTFVALYREPFQAVQLVPLADNSIAKVEFRYYPELASRLPGP